MKEQILSLVKQYINERQKKEWSPGDFVNYAGPVFDAEEYVAAINTLLDGWLVTGTDSLKFERKFPKHLGKDFGVLTNSGSSANLLMMSALTSKRFVYKLSHNTEVLVPVAGFPTTVNPIIQNGFKPVFVDIEIDTLNIDLNKVEEILKKRNIKVITFAHVLGNPPNMNRVMDLVKKYDLILLEDCCDALGSTYDNKLLGSFGEMASCSFYPAHHITMGEGGFVACKDSTVENILRSFREWGRGCYCAGPEANKLKCGTCKTRFSNWIPSLPDEVFDHKYVYDEIGYNLKPIEIQASIGLKQLDKLEYIVAARKENYKRLFKIYERYEEVFYLPRPQENSDPSWFAFPLTIKSNTTFSRADIVEYFESNGIQTRPYFAGNILLQPAYNHLLDSELAKRKYPVATYTMLNTFFHGTSPVITEKQIDYIEYTLDNFMRERGVA